MLVVERVFKIVMRTNFGIYDNCKLSVFVLNVHCVCFGDAWHEANKGQ